MYSLKRRGCFVICGLTQGSFGWQFGLIFKIMRESRIIFRNHSLTSCLAEQRIVQNNVYWLVSDIG